jgi:hypothetical protein
MVTLPCCHEILLRVLTFQSVPSSMSMQESNSAALGAHLRYRCMASLDLVASPLVTLMGCDSGHDGF